MDLLRFGWGAVAALFVLPGLIVTGLADSPTQIGTRWHDPVLETIDRRRRKQPDPPSRTKRNSPPCRDRIGNGRAEGKSTK
jgi:hypothetical protein